MRPASTVTLVAVAFLAFPAPGEGQGVVGRRESTFTLSERVGAGGWVRLYSQAGDITITEGGSGTMELRAEKEPGRGSIDDIGFRVLRDADGITVCAVYDDEDECDSDGVEAVRRRSRINWRNRARAHMTVRIPAGMRVRSGSGNGDLSLVSAAAEARLASGNGKVRVSGVRGRVSASSGNGEVYIENVGGPVTASSGNGDIVVGTVNGPVNASSGNGDIRVTMDRLSGSEDLEFSTGNGRILVELPGDFSADLEASTGNGRIVTDFPITVTGRLTPTRLRGTIGRGGRQLRLSSGNGAIDIRKRG